MIHRVSWLRSPVRSLVVIASLSAIAIGCSGDGGGAGKGATKPRVSASGKVEYEGKALEAGNISFISKDTGNGASAVITNGTYACKSTEGPNPGENTVLVTGREKADGPAVWTWTSKVDVPEGGLTAGGDFSITAKATKPAPKSNPDD